MGNDSRKYFNMEVEPLLNTPRMREIQLRKLQPVLRFFYDKVPFDKRRMNDAGVVPEDIGSFDDLSHAIPVVRQSDYRKVFQECDNNIDMAYQILFGDDRLKDLHLVTATSCAMGIPIPYPVFHKSAEAMGEIFGRIGWRTHIRPGDRLGICSGLSMHVAGTPHLYWFKKLPGLTLYPIGAEAGTERILQFIKMFKMNIYSGTPSLALHLIERAPEVLGEPVRNLGLKSLICGEEPGIGIAEVRKRLETEYGARVYDIGAGYGISCDHPEYQGMHWVADDYCYYELVDPETHEPITMEHGRFGLAVFTPLEPDSTVFFSNLRVTLNDIHQVFTEPCDCGLSGFRYKIIGRVDDMLKVKGVQIYPSVIQEVMDSFVPRITGAFRIVLKVPPPRVIPPLRLKVEYGRDISEGYLPTLEAEIADTMHSKYRIRPAITWLKPGTIQSPTGKAHLFDKLYER